MPSAEKVAYLEAVSEYLRSPPEREAEAKEKVRAAWAAWKARGVVPEDVGSVSV